MKRVISIFLSVVMLFSVTAGIDLSAYAGEDKEIICNTGWHEYYFDGNKKIISLNVPEDGILNIKIMHYMYVGIAVDNSDFSVCLGGDYCMDSGTENAPSTDIFDFSVSKGIYYITIYNGDAGKFKLNVEFESYGNNETEPNDFDHSMLLQMNKEITGAFTYDDDLDWYKISIPRSCNLKILLKLYTGVRFYVYNNDLSNCLVDDYYNEGGNMSSPTTSVYNVNVNSGTYYIKINCPSGYGKYKLLCNIICNSHKYNTTITKATAKKNGKIVKKCSVCGATTTTIIYYPKTISLSATSYTYNGKVKKPSVTVRDSKGKKISTGNYTVSYSSGRKNVGKYTVTVKFKGNYSGAVKRTFTIKPKSTSISRLTSGKKKFTVKWKKQSTQTTGYQIQYSTSSKFKTSKTVTVSKNKTTSKTIKDLKAKKKYYVRVRSYKTVKINGKSTKIYSSWSKAKAVTTKK